MNRKLQRLSMTWNTLVHFRGFGRRLGWFVCSERTKFAPVALISLMIVEVACAAGVQLPRQSLDSPGALIFNGYMKPDVQCFKCHNGDGSGSGRGPNLAKRVPKLTDAGIIRAINEGPGFMPSFKDKLDDTQKQQLMGWLRSRFGGQKG